MNIPHAPIRNGAQADNASHEDAIEAWFIDIASVTQGADIRDQKFRLFTKLERSSAAGDDLPD